MWGRAGPGASMGQWVSGNHIRIVRSKKKKGDIWVLKIYVKIYNGDGGKDILI